MSAVLRREFGAYFTSPIGYVFISVFYLFSGFFFFTYNLYGNTTDMRALFSALFNIVIFLIPILTMRLMSEDKKLKTDQALLTAPISLLGLVMGKYLAALLVYLVAISSTMLIALTISVMAMPDWAMIVGHFIGIFLLGAALIAIGMFISSLTENQVIAAVGGFCVGFVLILIDSLTPIVSQKFLKLFVTNISFYNRYQDFTLGILNFADVVFFLSIAVLFIFLTIRVLDKRRWS
ncbi:ABC transporter [Hydrogenoanaerobacterium sp.]|uniref:ABC transporter n=1 Tax=Hydrogenoanaerobacterium sp. TaxID=2953763 RepID=UPI0028979738|nr:ABC transporter [Hydrogenoanaerobacterium sp.]